MRTTTKSNTRPKKELFGLQVNLLFLTTLLFFGCKKDFLETIPNKALLVPQTITDFQRLLDNTAVMNTVPSLSLISGDEFYSEANEISAWYTPAERNSYTWASDIFEGQASSDWVRPFTQIFYANIVLDGLEGFDDTEKNSIKAKQLKGSALFYRAHAYFWLAQLYCQPYRISGNESMLGLPYRMHSDINEKLPRESLSDTYRHILEDLNTSLDLVPLTVDYKNRPSKLAVKGFLSRIMLVMMNYDGALQYANEALSQNSRLFDFNSLTATLTSSANPFPQVLPNGNEEVSYYATPLGYSFFSNTTLVDSILYRSYDNNDIRKSAYFQDRGKGQIVVKGDFAGATGAFNGIATDELLLIRAECMARAGDLVSAMNDINSLLIKRFKTGTYVNQTASTARDALNIILTERRKEMVRRGLRWLDLRRLNQDPATAKTIEHRMGTKIFLLEPQSMRYTFPIPLDEIIQGGLEQNPR